MLKRLWLYVEFGFGLLALTLLTLACHAVWPDKDGVAAWFQAIGSVAGIAIAIYVPWRQQDNQAVTALWERDQQRFGLARRLRALTLEFRLLCENLHGDVRTFSRVPSVNGFSFDLSSMLAISEAARRLEEQDVHFVSGVICAGIRMHIEQMRRTVIANQGRAQHALESDFVTQCDAWSNHGKILDESARGILDHCERVNERHQS